LAIARHNRLSGLAAASQPPNLLQSKESAMTKNLRPGDKVTWGTSQGRTKGVVEAKVTATTKIKGHTAQASEANPEYKVRSDKTGAEAVHKPGSLRGAR
jgi:hypothetical protein